MKKIYVMPDQAFTWVEVGCSDDVDDVLLWGAATEVDTLEVEETIADAASNGNTLEAMAAAVLVGVGWIRRALEEPVTGVVDDLMGSLPRRTCPPAGGFFVESSAALDFVLPEGGRLSSSQGQMASLEGTVGVLKDKKIIVLYRIIV